MTTLRQVLNTKADNTIHTIDAEASVYDAVALMSRAGIGAIVVTIGGRVDGAVCGIVTERDYARKVILQDKASRSTTVCEIMTAPVMSATSCASTEDCMALMTRQRIRHLPVMEYGRLVGVVSIGDLVRHLIEEQRFAIDQLETYVRGPRLEPPTCALTRRSPLPETLPARFA
jgi:signal-transduction protein with cAMP-binding, CBS, and nucleotidyltransferase domain